MNETTANKLSVAAAILLLFLTGIGNAKLMVVISGVVLVFGFLFFSGKMRTKIVVSALVGFGVAVLISRLLTK